jgi:hypothetical protein
MLRDHLLCCILRTCSLVVSNNQRIQLGWLSGCTQYSTCSRIRPRETLCGTRRYLRISLILCLRCLSTPSCIYKGLSEVRYERLCLRVLHRRCRRMGALKEHILRVDALWLLHKHREWVLPKQVIWWVWLNYRWACLLEHVEILCIDIVVFSNVISTISWQREIHRQHVHHILESLRIRCSLLLIIY